MDLGRRRLVATVFLAMALAGATGGLPAAVPQNQAMVAVASPRGEGPEAEAELEETIFQPSDRDLLRGLAQAKKLLQQQRYGEAVRQLGAILDSPQDYFFQPDQGAPVHRSLKTEAQRLIGQMPERGRDLYELQFGVEARKMLEKAAAGGDPAGLAEVARRFFHTQAGYEATLLLGLSQLDQGQPLAAALTLRRLRETAQEADRFEPVLSLATATAWVQAGAGDLAAKTLRALGERHPRAIVRIGGKEHSLPAATDDPLNWLAGLTGAEATVGPRLPEQWTMVRGDVARNAMSNGGPPLLDRLWRIPTSDHPLVQEVLEIFEQGRREESVSILPALYPLVVDDVVLMRTLQNLVAVDLTTGKRLWEVPLDDSLETTVGASARLLRQPYELMGALRQRVWWDTTYGTMSSDGRRVFTVEDLPLSISYDSPQQLFIRNRPVANPNWPQRSNRLVAHDIYTGKLAWQVGGSAKEPGLSQAGSYFLGPPLPLMGRLYALAESKGEIRLVAMDAASGKLLWCQQLAVVEQDILEDMLRRMVGVSPSYADGILVCPTANGAVVAVDLATRSLLWGYVYGRQSSAHRRLPARIVPPGLDYREDLNDWWIDGGVILADGCVLVAPVESDQLHCLRLNDGKLAWKKPREGDLYVGCVADGEVVLIGQKWVRAFRLADGMPAWDRGPLPLADYGAPSGTGFLAGSRYYVPLSSAKVLAIDVDSGKAASLCESAEDCMPGNLICYKDRIISQGTSGLDMFYQRDKIEREVTRRLARQPDDPNALRLRGEILVEKHHRDEAVECFRRAYQLAPGPITRQRLRDTLLDGLAVNFAAYRGNIKELESLVEEPRDKAKLLRLSAQGFQTVGRWRDALDACLKLADMDGGEDALEAVEKSRLVQRYRWVREQLTEMDRFAPPQIRQEIQRAVGARLDRAEKSPRTDDLRRWIACFGGTPQVDRAIGLLVARLADSGGRIEAEHLLLAQTYSADRRQAAAATAQLADMLRKADRSEDAAVCYDRLADEFADVVCQDRKTGRQLLDELPADDLVRRWMQPELIWPVGRVEVRKTRVSSMPTAGYGIVPINYVNSPTPFFSQCVVQYDQGQAQRRLVGRDGFGRQQWVVSLASDENPFNFNPNRALAGAAGHFLMLSTGGTMLGVDTLAPAASRVLWTRQLTEPPNLPSQDDGLRAEANKLFQISRDRFGVQPYQRGFGPTTAVTQQSIYCYQSRSCVALDPLSGKPLWIRQGISPETALVADDQYVFLVPPNQLTALALRAADGAPLGSRAVPVPSQWRDIVGRKILIQQHQGAQFTLAMFDPWQERELWRSQAFPADARIHVLDHEAVGVMDRTGHFMLLALEDGRALVDHRLEAENKLSEITVLKSEGQYLLVTHTRPQARGYQANARVQPGMVSRPVIRGRVYAFDPAGNEMWPEPVLVNNQQLLLNQPQRLPVLIFACNIYEQQSQRVRYQMSVLAIDKRSGRVLLEQRFPNQSSIFEIVGDPDNKTVEIRMQQQTVAMTFTDQPLPPESELRAEAARSRALWRMIHAMAEAIQEAAVDALDARMNPAEPPQKVAPQPIPQPPAKQKP